MIEMKYKKTSEPLILWKGIIDNFEACIVSYGTHPCAYIKVTDDFKKRVIDKLYEDGYFSKEEIKEREEKGYWKDDILISPHGGVTFYGDRDWLGDGTWLGWDYAHAGDYVWNNFDWGLNIDNTDEKRWKTIEIYDEIKEVIQQLKDEYYDV